MEKGLKRTSFLFSLLGENRACLGACTSCEIHLLVFKTLGNIPKVRTHPNSTSFIRRALRGIVGEEILLILTTWLMPPVFRDKVL